MDMLGYNLCLADPDLWIREVLVDDGNKYHEYMLLHTDDCLAVSQNPKEQLMEIDKYFPLKPTSIGAPKIYLGANVSKVQLLNGVEEYTMSMSQYVQEAGRNVEGYLRKRDLALPKKVSTPVTINYSPELDASDKLSIEDLMYYQSLIGILRWIVKMGRMDIYVEVSALSSFVAMP